MQRDDTAMSFLYFLRFVIFSHRILLTEFHGLFDLCRTIEIKKLFILSILFEINILNAYFIFIFYIFLLLFFCNVIIEIFYSFNLCDY